MGAKQLQSQYVTLSTIAKDLDCSVRTVQHWARAGKIETVKFLGRLLVDREYYEEWKSRNAIKR